MKLSEYAKRNNVTYKTAHRWWKAGKLGAFQLPKGTIMVREPEPKHCVPTGIALYARVSSLDQKADVTRQLDRLRDYAAAKGYHVTNEITEIASGLNDNRPKLSKLLNDSTIGIIVVEHRDRLTRFGFNYISQLLATQNRHVEVVFQSDTDNELLDDFVSVITSMAARIYGRRNSKRRANQVKSCVAQLMTNSGEIIAVCK